MRGHQQSNTRKLNRHWQSGGGGRKVVSFYMHANYPRTASNPGTFNANILIPVPNYEEEPLEINIDRSSASSGNQEYIFHLQQEREAYLFPSWYALGAALGYRDPDQDGNPTPFVHSTYYGEDRYAYYMNIYNTQDKYKMINLFVGAFYAIRHPDNLLYAYFNEDHVRPAMLGPIYFPEPNFASGVYGYSEEEWPVMAEIMSKIHIWVMHPSEDQLLLQPSSRTTTGPVRDGDGNIVETVTTNWFPSTFRIYGNPGQTFYYQDYMAEHPLVPHIHLPVSWAGRDVAGAPPYVYEYNPDIHRWSMVPMEGQYAKKIVIGGPYDGGTVPATNSPWYNRTFRQWMEVGEFIIHYDIDHTKTLEENMMTYAKTIR